MTANAESTVVLLSCFGFFAAIGAYGIYAEGYPDNFRARLRQQFWPHDARPPAQRWAERWRALKETVQAFFWLAMVVAGCAAFFMALAQVHTLTDFAALLFIVWLLVGAPVKLRK